MSKQKTKLPAAVAALGLGTTILFFLLGSLLIYLTSDNIRKDALMVLNIGCSVISFVYWILVGIIWSYKNKDGIEGPVCFNCHYSLRGLPSDTCPECGESNKGRSAYHRNPSVIKSYLKLLWKSIIIMLATGFVLFMLMVLFTG